MNKTFTIKLLLWVTPVLGIMTAPVALARHDQQILDRKITLELNDVALSVALREIEMAAGVKFVYSPSQLNLHETISVVAKQKRLGLVLSDLLGPMAISYTVDKQKEYILLKPRQADVERSSVGETGSALPAVLFQDVTGKVTDAGTQLPIAGVNVVVKGTTSGTSTDVDGAYTISAEEDDVLIFSFIGYKKFETQVGARMVIDVGMEEDVAALEEVVINGGYYETTDRLKTGNITKVTAKEIERQPVTSPLMALQGRVPGLDITPSVGVPGSAVQIEIRGRNSLRANSVVQSTSNPLFIIDGVPIDASPVRSGSLSLASSGFDPLSAINLANIESIEVLKDADATAIYGSRGANGVILITTRGARSGKTSFEVTASTGIGEITNRLDVLNTEQYILMRNEALANEGTTPGILDFDVNGNWDLQRGTDWQETLLGGTADVHDVQLGISGGNASTSFRLGGGFHKEGVVYAKGFGYKRSTGNLSVNHVSSDKRLKATFTVNYGQTANDLFDEANFVLRALNLPPNAPSLYNENGELNWAIIDFGAFKIASFHNPMASLRRTQEVQENNLIANGTISYQILNGLTFKTSFGISNFNNEEIIKYPLSAYAPTTIYPSTTAESTFGENSRKSWILEPQLAYTAAFSGHNINILVGTTWQETSSQYRSIKARGYVSDVLLKSLQGSTFTEVAVDHDSNYKYAAAFLRVGYNWKDKYLVNATGRRDGSSRFGPSRRFGNFGSVGLAWIFSNEAFISEHVGFLSFGKLRSSYGITGNDQIGDYKFYDTYSLSGRLYQGYTTLNPTALFNPDFSWEQTRKSEIGIELGFLRDRISLEGSWYRNLSMNQLVQEPLPATTGFAYVFKNFDATVENSGVEFVLSTRNIDSEKLTWITSFTFSRNKNILKEFSGIEDSPYANLYAVGKPLSVRSAYTFKGVNPQTGDYEMVDINQDGTINSEDKQFINPVARHYYGGFRNSIRYKSLELSFLFYFSKQKKQRYQHSLPGSRITNMPVRVLDRWQSEGDLTEVGKFETSNFRYITQVNNSTYGYSDASFIRLRTISLTYNISPKILQKVRMQAVKIFLQGQNMLTITNYLGFDPETGVSLPPLRMFTGGVSFTF